MKKILSGALLALLLLFGATALAEVNVAFRNDKTLGYDVPAIESSGISDFCYLHGKTYAYYMGYIGEILDEKNTFEIFAYQNTQDAHGRHLFTDGDKLLCLSQDKLYEVDPNADGSLIPVYENITLDNNNSGIHNICSDAQHIYTMSKDYHASTIIKSYHKQSGDVAVQNYPDNFHPSFGTYKNGSLYAVKSFYDEEYLYETYEIYALKNGEASLLLSVNNYPFDIHIFDFVYNPDKDEFYALADNYVYRINEKRFEKMALNVSSRRSFLLLKDADTLLLYNDTEKHEYPADSVLDTGNILNVAWLFDTELMEKFNAANTGYYVASFTATEQSETKNADMVDILFTRYNESRILDEGLPIKEFMDLSTLPSLQASADRCYPFIREHLYRDGKLLYIPYNVYGYDAYISAYKLSISKTRMNELGIAQDKLPKTYEEFASMLLDLYAETEGSFLTFAFGEEDDFFLSLKSGFLNSYGLECGALDKKPDMDYVKHVLNLLDQAKEACKKHTPKEDDYAISLLQRMYDVLQTESPDLLPLPLTALQDGRFGIMMDMDVAMVNENSALKEGALLFLDFMQKNIGPKNKAKIFADVSAKDLLYKPEELTRLNAQLAEQKLIQAKLEANAYDLPVSLNNVLLKTNDFEQMMIAENRFALLNKSVNEQMLEQYRNLVPMLYIYSPSLPNIDISKLLQEQP